LFAGRRRRRGSVLDGWALSTEEGQGGERAAGAVACPGLGGREGEGEIPNWFFCTTFSCSSSVTGNTGEQLAEEGG
jgi:hypothetical protein